MYFKREAFEKRKYTEIWRHLNFRSSELNEFAQDLRIGGKCLDIGCGDGTLVEILREKDIECFGVDITLEGAGKKDYLFEAPVWRMPFEDDEFDHTFSTDLFEHLPEKYVKEAVKEIIRITKYTTVHRIATFEAEKYMNYKVHLTIKSIDWWNEMFRNDKIFVKLIERK